MDKQEIIEKVLSCKEKLGLNTLPTARQLTEFGIYSNHLMFVGGLTEISKITKIPMKGKNYARGRKAKRKQVSEREIIQKILDCKEALGIDHMPALTQLYETGLTQKDIKKVGGLRRVSEKTGIPLGRTGRTPKDDIFEKQNIRPSRAFEKEREARKMGLHFADLQKSETLKIVGKIDVASYGRETPR